MRRFVAVAVLSSLVHMGGVVHVGAEAPTCVNGLNGGSITCGGDTSGSNSGRSGGSGGSSGAPSGKVYQPVDATATGPDGAPCTSTTFVEVPPGSPELPASTGRDTGNALNSPPPCPAAPGAPAESPAQVAARYWEEIPLPSPGPAIAPGWAISGKLAYLETRGERTHTYYNDTPLGQLEIVATGTYEVDWGDGTDVQTFDVEGEPWPDGIITHDYQWAGHYDIVVTEHWNATWHLGGGSGSLRRLRTEGRIDDFEVRQIQAIRYR